MYAPSQRQLVLLSRHASYSDSSYGFDKLSSLDPESLPDLRTPSPLKLDELSLPELDEPSLLDALQLPDELGESFSRRAASALV